MARADGNSNGAGALDVSGRKQDRGTRRLMLGGAVAVVALFAGLGGWASVAKIEAAVVASGTVIVEGRPQQVQHAEGGIVGALLVREGQRVARGEVLLRLDATTTRAELEILRQRLIDLRLRQARLIAARDKKETIAFPEALVRAAAQDPELARQLVAQQRILNTNRARINSQLGQIKARVAQLKNEIAGLKAQGKAKVSEIKYLKNDLKRYGKLNKQRLISRTKMNDRWRMEARVAGERGRITADLARAAGQIAEMQIRAAELRSGSLADVLKELNDVSTQIAELSQKEIAALDRLSRIEIRSPSSGVVHELMVNTVGGVIAPRAVLMKIVPDNDKLIVETQVAISDIDEVHAGKAASVRFSAFSQRTTPELDGTVISVSPDHSVNEQTGVAYYTARVRLKAGERRKLGGQQLIPGMPSDVMIKGENRTVLSYLWKPLADQLTRAFRES